MQQTEIKAKAGSLWRHSNFRKLWISDTISQFGGQFSGAALPIIGGALLHANEFEFGILVAAGTAPWLLFALPVGAWVDQRRRRPIMIVANIGRAIMLAMIPLAWFFRNSTIKFSLFNFTSLFSVFNIYTLYLVAFVVGLLTVFFDISYQSYLPSLIERDQLVEGNSKLETSRATAQVAGPTLAGAVINAVSVSASPLACVGDAVGFLSSSYFLNGIDKAEDIPENTTRIPVISQIKEGLGVVFGDRRLRSIAGSTSTSNFFGSAMGALTYLFVTRDLRIDVNYYPILLGVTGSIGSLGALFGAIIAGKLGRLLGVGPVIIVSIFISTGGSLFLAYAIPDLAVPLLIISVVIVSWGGVVYNVNQVSLRQAIVPQEIQGRMNATMRFLVWGTIPLGGLFGGIVGTAFGVRPAMEIAALGGLLAGFWVLLSPVRKLRVIPETPVVSEKTGNTVTG